MTLFFFTYILLQNISPQVAVDNISNTGLVGSLFILVLFLLIGILILFWRATKKQFDELGKRVEDAEKKADQAEKQLFDYIKTDRNILLEIIKNYTDTNDKLTVVLNKILIK